MASVEITRACGPIRVNVSASEPVKLRIASAPVAIRVAGMPGPQGKRGDPGPKGEKGPSGSLEEDATIDGGNF